MPMGQNVAQKLIGSHLAGGEMTAGSEIGLRIDQTLTAWCAIRLLGHSGCLRRVGPGNVSGRAERS